MKPSMLSRIALTGILAVILGIGAQSVSLAAESTASADEVKQETRDLLHALESYGTAQRDEALQKSRAALDNIDHRIEALEAELLDRWQDMDQAARDQARASLQALREQRTRVAEWYGSMKSGSATAWGHLKQGFSSAYQALHDAWEQSEQDIHSGADR